MDAFNCRNLSLRKKGRVILKDISCQIPQGKFTAIIGPNGAGKSTLLRTLAGLEDKRAALSVCLGGEPLSSLSVERRSQLLAWAPEATSIPFAFRVWEVVLMGSFPSHKGKPRQEHREHAAELLTLLRLQDKKESSVLELSSGELRKLALARALAQKTPHLLLDEPCANLDIAASLQVLSLLKELSPAKSSVCACLHDLSLARRFADYVILLKDGRHVISGPVQDVLNEKVVEEVFQVKVQTYKTPQGEIWGFST